MLVNWKIKYCNEIPNDKQPPDYYIKDKDYWFYRYFKDKPEIDVVDISSFKWLEDYEKNKIRFYIWQTLKIIPRLHKYDLIVSHGMQSGVVLSLIRRIFKTKAKHIVFDIGSFNSAAESGFALKLMQFSSKSIDGIIYHTSSQLEYYKKFFPWIVDKSYFIRFGTDLDFFDNKDLIKIDNENKYIVCVGYNKRDWKTLVEAYKKLSNKNIELRLIGKINPEFQKVSGIKQFDFIPIKDLINQIYNAEFCVLPLESFNYSYGQMTLMQSMALEKCVIAAKVPSLIDYLEDRKTGLFYIPKNVDDLKEKISFCIKNTKELKDIGQNARNYLLYNCNEEIMAIEIEKIYNKILMK